MLMVLNSTMVGLLYTVIAVMTNEYPELLDINTAQANLVGSVLLGTFLATGKQLFGNMNLLFIISITITIN